MFAVIDCGTTMSRIYIVDNDKKIVASGRKKVGVRDTSITGSRDALRNGLTELFYEVLTENNISDKDVEFAIASGMITSEIGLMEIPHLIAPVGLKELTDGIKKVEDPTILPINRPVYFIRGIKNHYPKDAGVKDLRYVDFMRGEEVQCIGVMNTHEIEYPCSIVALSSHTKIMYINEKGEIEASDTTISGQFYEALINSTNIGKSLIPVEGEEAGGYTYEELVEAGLDCAKRGGLIRACMMPRFLQVLLKSNYKERSTFMDAAIAADDLMAFNEMVDQGYKPKEYVLYGQESRCKMYEYLLKKTYGDDLKVELIYDKEEVDNLTVNGSIAVALNSIENDINK